MQPLLMRIGSAVAARVRDGLDISELLNAEDLTDAIDLVDGATSLLNRWREFYIPDGTDDKVWGPFDEHALFSVTDATCQRCCELREVLNSLRHTNEVLLPELKRHYQPDRDLSSSSKLKAPILPMEYTALERAATGLKIGLENALTLSIPQSPSRKRNAPALASSGKQVDIFHPSNKSLWELAVQDYRNGLSEMMKTSKRLISG